MLSGVKHRYIHIVLISFVMGAWSLTRDIGLADNGDFSRVMTVFTSGPVGFTINWPNSDTPDYRRRFFEYFLPEWKLDWPSSPMVTSSALLLWWPGVALSQLFYSPDVLYLPIMSLPSLGVLLFCFWKLLQWIENNGPNVLYLTLAVPFALIITDANYIAYLNSFYQDGPAFVFTVALLASLFFYIEKKSGLALLVCAIACLFLATSKAAFFYWPIVGMGVCGLLADNVRHRLAAAGLGIVCLVASIWLMPATPDLRTNSAGQAIINGVLVFSDAPSQRFEEVGIVNKFACVGNDIFTRQGEECFNNYRSWMNYETVLRITMAEPLIAARMFQYSALRMQIAKVNLGHYQNGDSRVGNIRNPIVAPVPAALAIMSNIKTYFPTDYLLNFTLCVGLLLSGLLSLYSNKLVSISTISWIALLACVCEMTVAIFGNGRSDIIKHLFIANVLFDIGFIACANVGAWHLFRAIAAYRSRTHPL
jgi:hypothetical protein